MVRIVRLPITTGMYHILLMFIAATGLSLAHRFKYICQSDPTGYCLRGGLQASGEDSKYSGNNLD